MEEHLEISGWLRWLTTAEGGRISPHPGGRYAATAFPDPGTIEDLRSIVFDDVPPGPGKGSGEGAVNARWLVPAALPMAGVTLVITEGHRPVAVVKVQATGPAMERPWSFRVSESFTITGHGTAAMGAFSGTISHGTQPAELHSRVGAAVPVTVSLEFARMDGADHPALLVRGLGKDEVPPGSLIRAPGRTGAGPADAPA